MDWWWPPSTAARFMRFLASTRGGFTLAWVAIFARGQGGEVRLGQAAGWGAVFVLWLPDLRLDDDC
jgi:hypothetical protein